MALLRGKWLENASSAGQWEGSTTNNIVSTSLSVNLFVVVVCDDK